MEFLLGVIVGVCLNIIQGWLEIFNRFLQEALGDTDDVDSDLMEDEDFTWSRPHPVHNGYHASFTSVERYRK